MQENRKQGRARSFARTLLQETGAYGYIADISPTGFRVRVPGDIPRPLAGKHRLIISLEEISIPAFQVEAECRWSREEPKSILIGFEAVAFLEGGRGRYDALLEYYRTMEIGVIDLKDL